MDFDDLGTDVALECPHCNRKFQQDEGAQADVAACPGCGGEVKVDEQGDAGKR